MKDKLTSDLKSILLNCRNWAQLELEYVKLTATEKLTIFLTAVMVCSIALLLGMAFIIMLSFCLVDVFKMFLSPWLACLCVGGVLLLLVVLVILLRTPLIMNPISKFLSKLIIGKENQQI